MIGNHIVPFGYAKECRPAFLSPWLTVFGSMLEPAHLKLTGSVPSAADILPTQKIISAFKGWFVQ
jgi:hypothetical protein